MLIWFSRLVKLHPVEITFLIPEPIAERGAKEIQRHFTEAEQHLRDLVRCVSYQRRPYKALMRAQTRHHPWG